MKKVLSIILIIASVLTLFCACNKEKVDESGLYSYVVLDDDTAKITKYNGTEPVVELKIPSALDDYTVTVIGTEAFKDVQTITVVRTPDTLTKIEDYAFANSSVKKALMNRSPLLTEIGAYAFYGTEVSKVTFEEGSNEPLTIGEKAFANCASGLSRRISILPLPFAFTVKAEAPSSPKSTPFTQMTVPFSVLFTAVIAVPSYSKSTPVVVKKVSPLFSAYGSTFLI